MFGTSLHLLVQVGAPAEVGTRSALKEGQVTRTGVSLSIRLTFCGACHVNVYREGSLIQPSLSLPSSIFFRVEIGFTHETIAFHSLQIP